MIRSVEEWVGILVAVDSTNEGDDKAAARRIVKDLIHYSAGTASENDVNQLANAMTAYARLLQEYGVKA